MSRQNPSPDPSRDMRVPDIEDLVASAEGFFTREEIESFIEYCFSAVRDAPHVAKTSPATLTKASALALGYRDDLYHLTKKDSRGQPVKARVNGKVKVWKREVPPEQAIDPRDHPPGDFILPAKYGMYDSFDITPRNAHEWTAEEPRDWPQVASAKDIETWWTRPYTSADSEVMRLQLRHLKITCAAGKAYRNEEGEMMWYADRDENRYVVAHVEVKKEITNLDDWSATGMWQKVGADAEYPGIWLLYQKDFPWAVWPHGEGYLRTNPLDTSDLRGSLTPHEAISVLFQDLIESALVVDPDAFPKPVALIVDEETALNGRDPHSRAQACAGLNDEKDRGEVFIAPKLVTGCLDDGTPLFEATMRVHGATGMRGGRLTAGGAKALRDRQVGVLSHELGHIALMFRGDHDHTERDADAEAERLFGKRINYDIEDVQTVGRGVHPRPKRLDVDENPGRPGRRGCRMNSESNMKRGTLKSFREYLNVKYANDPKHKNRRFEQKTRKYGDYLFAQDREQFDVLLEEALADSLKFPDWVRP